MNPLYKETGGDQQQLPGAFGNFQQMMQQFRQFKANFQGDPKAEVQRLLQSGQMTQQQLDQLQQAAQMFQSLL